MSLHFTPPMRSAILANGSGSRDIASDSFGTEVDTTSTVAITAENIKIASLSRVSISYDV